MWNPHITNQKTTIFSASRRLAIALTIGIFIGQGASAKDDRVAGPGSFSAENTHLTIKHPNVQVPSARDPFSSWRVDHVGIRVPDFGKAVEWYTHVLNFRLLQSVSLRGMTFGFVAPEADDSFRIEIMGGPGAAPRPSYQQLGDSYNLQGWHHVGIRVADVDASIAELRRRGVGIVSDPHDVPVLRLRLAFFADPWGNLLEVTAPMQP